MNNETQDTRIRYLYRITNKENGKIYIGQTVQPDKRWYDHKRDAAQEKPTMVITWAIKKYGNEAFKFEVIAGCKTWEDTNEMETLLVAQYGSLVPNGYNVPLGGYNAPKSETWIKAMKDWHASLSPGERAEISQKQSESHLGEKNPMFGTKHTEEWKQMMSKVHKGSKKSKETRKKMSEKAKANRHLINKPGRRKLSPEQTQAILNDTRPHRIIAKEYGVERELIGNIKKRGN